MDLEVIILSEVSQTEKDRTHLLRAAAPFYYSCGLCLFPIRRGPSGKKSLATLRPFSVWATVGPHNASWVVLTQAGREPSTTAAVHPPCQPPCHLSLCLSKSAAGRICNKK